jgi:hypothetical protein
MSMIAPVLATVRGTPARLMKKVLMAVNYL